MTINKAENPDHFKKTLLFILKSPFFLTPPCLPLNLGEVRRIMLKVSLQIEIIPYYLILFYPLLSLVLG
jgi:hypothetical protein